MSNCKIVLLTDQNGNFTYKVTITVFDIIGSIYPFTGNPCGDSPCDESFTFQEMQDTLEPIRELKLGRSRSLPRDTVYDNITHKNIRNFLFDKTGSAQNQKLTKLYRLWLIGHVNPTISFTFD